MTDLSLINEQLKSMMGLEDSDLDKYHSLVEGAASFAYARLKNEEDMNSALIVHFCAARAYYQILLLNQSDDITSFKAGDVSYQRASSALDNAKALYEQAKEQCALMLKSSDNGFAFKVV